MILCCCMLFLPVARMTRYLDHDINEAYQFIIMSQTFGVVLRVTQSSLMASSHSAT